MQNRLLNLGVPLPLYDRVVLIDPEPPNSATDSSIGHIMLSWEGTKPPVELRVTPTSYP